MQKKSFKEINGKFEQLKLRERFDLIVAIAHGGIVPACLLAQKLNLEMVVIRIKYRDKANKIIYAQPKGPKRINFCIKSKRLLVVDDVTRSGATLNAAKKLLSSAKQVKTFVINGKANYRLYNEPCFLMPWTG